MAAANRRRTGSPPATASSSRDPASTTSSAYFPPELIPEVASRLTSLQDFFALRAACRAYRALLPLTASNLASQAPLLLAPHAATGTLLLFHLSLRRNHRLRLPDHLTADDDSFTRFNSVGCRLAFHSSRREFRIVHLLTGEQYCLPSPPEVFVNIILSGDLLVTWNYLASTIQYCHLDAADWCLASIVEPYVLHVMVCVNGTLYALVTRREHLPLSYHLAVAKISDSGNLVELELLGGNLDARAVYLPEESDWNLCLAECRGELILLSTVGFKPRVYDVFRWKADEAKWTRITSLGGCTLFFEGNCFVGCLGPHHPGIKGDCIYFAEWNGHWSEYSLVDGSFREFAAVYPREVVKLLTEPPVWVLSEHVLMHYFELEGAVVIFHRKISYQHAFWLQLVTGDQQHAGLLFWM
ncbi:hypothetical protein ACP70R_001313 [Stipagrostis hirtigluma subsp. patula]